MLAGGEEKGMAEEARHFLQHWECLTVELRVE